ncbi:MAG: P1 family peptidase [Gemmatimonadaceae bacterium]|nr:P1 family peptidase [Gemmatimonadaceae bacterium]
MEFDFPGLLIGTAEYDEGPTGVTVFYFPNRVKGAVDVRGGNPGTVNTDALRLGYQDRQMSAVVLSGGSWHGLSAVTGVADEIRFSRTDNNTPPAIHGVAGAIVNDLGSAAARRRFSIVTPDQVLARAAVGDARPGKFHLGARGAGRFAMTGGALGLRETSGQGGAFRQIGPTKIAVFTVVNAAGLVVDRSGQVVRCREMHWGTKCGSATERLAGIIDTVVARATGSASFTSESRHGPSDNTTISLVVTNQKLEWAALNRLAAQVHTSMARGIQPFATASDGDVLYAVTTDEVENPRLSAGQLGLIASELAWDAILSSLPKGDPRVKTSVVSLDARTLDQFVGEYELGPGSPVSIMRNASNLFAQSPQGGMYIASGVPNALTPVGEGEFLIAGARHDVIRFSRDGEGRVTGLVINPGNWAIPGRRLGPR